MVTVTVDFKCPCGGNLKTTDDIRSDASIVTCQSCGKELGTYGALMAEGMRRAKEKGAEVVRDQLDKMLMDTLGKSKHFKIIRNR